MASNSVLHMLDFAINQVNRLYVWGGKGAALWTENGLLRHPWRRPVYDCSGLVTSAYHFATGRDHRADWNAQSIFEECEEEEQPSIGSVACYGRKRCTHVMMHVAEGIVVGASGGDSSTLTPRLALSKEREAKAAGRKLAVSVHSFPSHTYRQDFLGWRKLPFD